MTTYVTTLGQRIYLPAGWSKRGAASRLITMRHEAVHLRQFRRYTFVGMSLLYLLPIVPLGLAIGRARLEWEAYRETITATFEILGPAAAEADPFLDHLVLQFTGPAYGWMWPFPGQVRSWIRRHLDELRAEGTRSGSDADDDFTQGSKG
ncbi:MAG: hypothetical protein AAGF12_18250 [Myxococcota bacterium]